MPRQKETKTNAMRLLESMGIDFRQYRYECGEFTNGRTAADLLGLPHELVYKTLVTEGSDREHYVFVIPVDGELDLKKAARSVGAKSVMMISVKDITPVTGYVRGGCTAIGMKKRFVTRIDKSAEEKPAIIVSGGRIGSQIELRPEDLRRAADAEYAELMRDI